jgi:hypothetical protein
VSVQVHVGDRRHLPREQARHSTILRESTEHGIPALGKIRFFEKKIKKSDFLELFTFELKRLFPALSKWN